MPFTISHAAAVLPLRRFTRLPLAALMIGSLSPDFLYFIPWHTGLMTHNFPALFWFCWPSGLALWFLFVRVVEAPTLALLPDDWRARFTPSEKRITPGLLTRTSIAVILGAATHVIWDSFTHGNTPVVDALPFLRVTVFEIGGYALPLYKLLQHLSTLFGLVVLGIWAWRLKPEQPLRHSAVSNFARTSAGVLLFTTSCIWGFASAALHSTQRLETELFHLAIGGMTGWALAWIAVAVFLNRRLRANSLAVSANT
jgi:hypothetical protein